MQELIGNRKANKGTVIMHNNRFINRLLGEIPGGLSPSAFHIIF